EFGMQLYEAGVNALGWNDRTKSLVQAFDDPRWITMTMMLAREVGDVTTERRMKAVAEREWGPNFFGDDEDRFAWGFGLPDKHPRGQLNGLMILSEIGGPGAWTDVYKGSRDAQFDLPTVEGVDYPHLGISRAINDQSDNTLYVTTYAATAARRGSPTSWKVTQLADPKSIQIYRGDQLFHDWGRTDEHTIEINSTIDDHEFRIVGAASSVTANGDRSRISTSDRLSPGVMASSNGSPTTMYRPAAPPSCACC
ncbi:MAG: hypothetical protein ACI9BW_004195, partial [Gammaproteobacteria bacterium]